MLAAVFTKNLTNPAYGAARLGAERAAALFGAEVLHFVPKKGDDPDEQSALIDLALAMPKRPDISVARMAYRSLLRWPKSSDFGQAAGLQKPW